MAQNLGTVGAQIDIDLRAGDTLGPYKVYLTDATGRPLDLTGNTFVGAFAVLATPGDTLMTVVVVGLPTAGVIQFSYAATSSLTGGDFFTTLASYAWRIKMTDAAGTVSTLIYGKINVAAGTLP